MFDSSRIRLMLSSPWTFAITGMLLVLNLGLFVDVPAGNRLLDWMQYDRTAIVHGEVWRLVTGNLVHWSAEHFWLDVAAFAVLGWMYEKSLGRTFPWLLLASGLGVGVALLFLPELATYRGLSGIDSGLFAAALCCECRAAKTHRSHWGFVIPMLLMFTIKLVYECSTGQLFFGTDSLGDLGQPVPLSHVAGAVAALGLIGGVTSLAGPQIRYRIGGYDENRGRISA